MSWGDPKRVRTAVRHKAEHIGYVTTTSYPDRDLAMFPEGSPYSEIVVSDLRERHIALLQRFKEHWLIHCGPTYDTTEGVGELNDAQVMKLAIFALQNCAHASSALVEELKLQVERMLK